jgi:hypothetical protein
VGHSLPEELWPDIVTPMATLADLTCLELARSRFGTNVAIGPVRQRPKCQ